MLGEIAAEGDRLRTLEALRDYYATLLDLEIPSKDAAAVGRRLESVLEQIDLLKEPVDHDLVDELRRKRAERVAGARAAGS